MPIHQYDAPPGNRYAGSIADILQQQGLIQARRAEQVGHATARAAEQSGNAWGGAVQNIAQAVASMPAQYQQAKQQQLQGQIQTQRFHEIEQAGKDRAAVRAEAEQAKHDDYAAQIGHEILLAGGTPDAVRSATARAVQAGALTPEEAQQFHVLSVEHADKIPDAAKALLARSPKGQAVLEKLNAPPKAAEPYTLGEGQQRYGGDNTLVASGPAKPPPAAHLETRSLDVQAAEALARGDQVTYDRLLKVKKQMGQADDRPRITVNTGPNAAAPPGDFEKTGADFLKTIPPQWRQTVKKIAAYDLDPTKVASMRGGNREMLTQWVNQVNPEYDAGMFTNRAPTRKAFTTGVQGQQINAINTAIGHIDQLTTLAAGLGTGGFVPGNKAFNAVRTMFGGDAVTNFDTLKDALAGEVSSVLSKGGATVSGIAEAKEKIHGANSPTQLAGYVKTLIPIMGSKLSSLDYQYHQAMGERDAFSALSPEVKGILSKHGFDPAHPTVGQDAARPAAPSEGQAGSVNGVAAVWKTVNGKTGWYAK